MVKIFLNDTDEPVKRRRESKPGQLFLDLPSIPYLTNRNSKRNQSLNFGSCYEEELVKNAKAKGVSVYKTCVDFFVIQELWKNCECSGNVSLEYYLLHPQVLTKCTKEVILL